MNQPSSPESAEIPKLTIVAGLIFQEKKILLVHNIKTDGQKRFEPPGGKVEDGESPEAAVVRELEEELSIAVTLIRHIGSYMTHSTTMRQTPVLTFECEIESGEPSIPESERRKLEGFGWYTVEELLALSGTMDEDREIVVVPNLLDALDDIEKYLAEMSA